MADLNFKLVCSRNFELNSVIVDAKAISQLLGEDPCYEKRWLCDECVNGVLTAITEPERDVYVFSSYTYERLRRKFEYGCKQASLKKHDFLLKTKWVIPACISSHWTAAVIDTENHEIVMLDSFHVQQISLAKKLIDFSNYFLSHNVKNWTVHYDMENIPLQVNTYDCGVLMLMALWGYITNERLPIDSMECKSYRQQFLNLIAQKSVHQQQGATHDEPGSSFQMKPSSPLLLNSPLPLNSSLKLDSPSPNSLLELGSLSPPNSLFELDSPSPPGSALVLDSASPPNSLLLVDSASPPLLVDSASPPLLVDSASPPLLVDSASPPNSPSASPFNSPLLVDSPSPPNSPLALDSPLQLDSPLKSNLFEFGSISKWNKLPSTLQLVLPPQDEYSYVIEDHHEINSAESDSPHFSAVVRINLADEKDANLFMEQMSKHSMCTFRTTKTVKTCNKRVKCKFVRHCQHFAKKLTPKQAEKFALARAKKAKAPLVSQIRNKKTKCPSSFILTVQIPTKAQRMKAESKPYFTSHCGV